MDWRDLQISIRGAGMRPMGDFVLVRAIPPEPGAILNPNLVKTGDGRYKDDNRRRGLRRGRVVVVGPGDKVERVRCGTCGLKFTRQPNEWDATREGYPCRCGGIAPEAGSAGRHVMHVRVGEEVVYPRVPANEIIIDGEEYTLCHEEQHILAVIEA